MVAQDDRKTHLCKSEGEVILILGRKKGESLLIGEDGEIKITVMDIRGSLVRLGIDAPRETPVHREEIFKRIQKEKDPNPYEDIPSLLQPIYRFLGRKGADKLITEFFRRMRAKPSSQSD